MCSFRGSWKSITGQKWERFRNSYQLLQFSYRTPPVKTYIGKLLVKVETNKHLMLKATFFGAWMVFSRGKVSRRNGRSTKAWFQKATDAKIRPNVVAEPNGMDTGGENDAEDI